MTALITPFLSAFITALEGLYRTAAVWDGLLLAGVLAGILALMHAYLGSENGGEVSRPGSERPAHWEWALLALITLAGAALRFYGRATVPYWWDELLAVWMGQAPIPVMVASLFTPQAPASDFTPPLFYMLLHGWMGLAGSSESATRLLIGIFSTLSIPALYCVGRALFSPRTGLIAALLLAVSPSSLFYAQQVRCYSLLGLLALLAVLAAWRANRTGRSRDIALLGVIGVFFLFTHYVASWLWLGLSIATVLPRLAAVLARPAAGTPGVADTVHILQRRRVWLAALLLGGFGVAALCPIFSPPPLGELSVANNGLGWVYAVAGLALLLLATNPEWRKAPTVWPPAISLDTPAKHDLSQAPCSTGSPGTPALPSTHSAHAAAWKATLALAAGFVVPALIFALWLLPSGILGVLGGTGSSKPGSYGFAELSVLLTQFAGPQASLERSNPQFVLFLLLAGLFGACVRAPRAALTLLGWVAFPLALAMAIQSQSMNLVRYLFATLPGYLLLMALAVSLAVDGLLGVAKNFKVPRALAGLSMALALLLAAGVFGFRAYTATDLPTVRANIENYAQAARRLNAEESFLLQSESPNLVLALSWHLRREGRTQVAFGPTSPRMQVANVFMDGSFWHPLAPQEMGLFKAGQINGDFGQIALFKKAAPTAPAPWQHTGPGNYSLDMHGLGESVVSGQGVAQTLGHTGGLIPLAKAHAGSALYRLKLLAPTATNMHVRLEGLVTGPHSRVQAALTSPRLPGWQAIAVLGPDERLGGATTREGREVPLLPAQPADKGLTFDLPGPLAAGDTLDVAVELLDDGSGVINSSTAVLRGIHLEFGPPGEG